MMNMAAHHHECDAMKAVFKILPNVVLAKDVDGWRMDVDRYAFPISFCPFCGVELDVPLQSTRLCEDLVPTYGKCERAKHHSGNHRAAWS